MQRPSWKSLAQLTVATLVLVGGSAIWLRDSSAAISARPEKAARTTCNGNRNPVINVNKGPDVQTFSTGAIQAVAGETYTGTDGREVTELTVLGTLTKGKAEGIGDLTITNDTSREAPAASLVANQADKSFPATQVMRFHPVIVLNGETFRTADSAEPATLVNTCVRSFPPPEGTAYELTNALTLQSDDGNTITVHPGKVFTITGSSSS